MNSFLSYLGESSLSFTLLFGCLWLIARQNTFHRLNRLLLLAIAFLGIVSPLLELPVLWQSVSDVSVLEGWDAVPDQVWAFTQPVLEQAVPHNSFPIWRVLMAIYLMGVMVMLWRFLRNLWYIRQHLQWAEPTENHRLLLSDHPHVPFSFFGWIVMPADSWGSPEAELMLAHEQTHVRQGHSWDNLLAELCLIVCWFNPVVWVWRRMLRSVHEYLADEAVLARGVEMLPYLQLLGQQARPTPAYTMAHSFFSPIILNRLRMLTSPHSPNRYKWRYILLIPVLGFMLTAFDTPVKVTAEGPLTFSVELTPVVAPVISQTIPSIKPIEEENISRVSSGFGMRTHPHTKKKQHHTGIDMVAAEGTPVLATADGVVSEAKSYPRTWGNRVILQHGETYQTMYGHMQSFTVKAGQTVKIGDIIGYVGNTGFSTGPHLHYEVRKDGKPVDPAGYFPQ